MGAMKIGSQVLNGVHNFLGSAMAEKMQGYLLRQISAKAAAIDAITYEDPESLDTRCTS